MREIIRIRPHHFLVLHTFVKKPSYAQLLREEGYDDEFIRHLKRISKLLYEDGNDNVIIKVVPSYDDLCRKCTTKKLEYIRKEGRNAPCITPDDVSKQPFFRDLGLDVGQAYKSGEIRSRIKDYERAEEISSELFLQKYLPRYQKK